MFIGSHIKDRMELFEMDLTTLSEETFIDEDVLENILEDKITYNDIDKFDIDMIASVLFCVPEYFIDSAIREKDMILNSLNRKEDSIDSILVKGKIQNFIRDFVFVQNILVE